MVFTWILNTKNTPGWGLNPSQEEQNLLRDAAQQSSIETPIVDFSRRTGGTFSPTYKVCATGSHS